MFLAMLSQRDKPLILSAHHDFAPVAEFASKFMAINRTPAIRANFPKMKTPPGTSHLTNVPDVQDQVVNKCAPPPLTGEEAVDQIMGIIRRAAGDQENAIIASVIKILKGQNRQRIKHHENVRNSNDSLLAQAIEKNDELDAIVRGYFALLELSKRDNG